MSKEFREFAMRGNVVDMAVGIVVGASFGSISSALVADVIMPPIGSSLGKVDFSNLFATLRECAKAAGPHISLADARTAGAVTVDIGVFINTVASFLIAAFAIFLVIRGMSGMKREAPAPAAAPTTKDRPFCCTAIPTGAKRCPHCTSQL